MVVERGADQQHHLRREGHRCVPALLIGPVAPTTKDPEWYGVSTESTESAERGLRLLRERGLLERATRVKDAPLSPTGKTQEYHYTLKRPFVRSGRPKLTVIGAVAS